MELNIQEEFIYKTNSTTNEEHVDKMVRIINNQWIEDMKKYKEKAIEHNWKDKETEQLVYLIHNIIIDKMEFMFMIKRKCNNYSFASTKVCDFMYEDSDCWIHHFTDFKSLKELLMKYIETTFVFSHLKNNLEILEKHKNTKIEQQLFPSNQQCCVCNEENFMGATLRKCGHTLCFSCLRKMETRNKINRCSDDAVCDYGYKHWGICKLKCPMCRVFICDCESED
jgi:hypothetical protein